MAENFVNIERKNLYSSTDAIGERVRVNALIRQGREEGMDSGARAARAPGADAPIKGRDISLSKADRIVETYAQRDNETFLKYNEEMDSNAIAVRKNEVAIQAGKGNVGILVRSNGDVRIQSKVVLTASGKNIIKGDYTENPQSSKLFTSTENLEFIGTIKEAAYEAAGKLGIDLNDQLGSGTGTLMTDFSGYPPHNHNMLFKHVHAVEPAYLFRMPAVSMLDGVMNLFKKLMGVTQ